MSENSCLTRITLGLLGSDSNPYFPRIVESPRDLIRERLGRELESYCIFAMSGYSSPTVHLNTFAQLCSSSKFMLQNCEKQSNKLSVLPYQPIAELLLRAVKLFSKQPLLHKLQQQILAAQIVGLTWYKPSSSQSYRVLARPLLSSERINFCIAWNFRQVQPDFPVLPDSGSGVSVSGFAWSTSWRRRRSCRCRSSRRTGRRKWARRRSLWTTFQRRFDDVLRNTLNNDLICKDPSLILIPWTLSLFRLKYHSWAYFSYKVG